MGNKPSFMLQDEEITIISEETGFSPAQIERLYSRFTALDKSGNGSLSRQDCLAIPELAINPLCDRIVHMFFIDCDEDHERINFRQFMKVLATFRSSHKSSPRQDSLSQQQKQSYIDEAPLLFDTIPLSSSGLTRHSRHSSYHDGFHDAQNHHHSHQHRTTNQHSVHYAASSTHLPHLLTNGHQNHHHNGSFSNGYQNPSAAGGQSPLVDPDEPPNSRKQKLYFMFKVYDVNNDDLVDLQDLEAILRMMVGTYVDEQRVHMIAERTLREADKNCDGVIDFEEFCGALGRQDIDESMRVRFACSS